MSTLDAQLQLIAQSPILLVATDYDGTLSPIVSDPALAKPHREAMVAIQTLAELPQTHVAVISGRSLRDLAALTGEPEGVHLVGSHGSEFDPDFAASLAPESTHLLHRVAEQLEKIASVGNGFLVEKKPASVAFHYRNVDAQMARQALEEVYAGFAGTMNQGVHVRHGKMVVELSVVDTNKGVALETLRHRMGASAAIFFGDDVTDEDAFATLHGPDIGIKVGGGESVARHRVDNPHEVAQVLARLCELRAAWVTGAHAVPIEEHSMLSDRRTLALVTPEASVCWLCAPRADSPALFASLLGGPTAGQFSIEADDGSKPIDQAYVGNSFVLETRWSGFTVTDYLDCSGGRGDQRAGRTDLTRVIKGQGEVRIDFSPRLDFGRDPTQIIVKDFGLVIEGTLDPIVLRSPGVAWTIHSEGKHHRATATVRLGDEPLVLVLRYGTGNLNASMNHEPERRAETLKVWEQWSDGLKLPSIEQKFVRQSAMVLKGLTHGPSGSILAAGTTSLPEHIGGVRNWDYRFCWLRDASMSASSLVRLGSNSEAMGFLDWVLGVVDKHESPERLCPLYTVTGGMLGSEGEIGELSGYRGSRPVRVGNAASRQVQLDVFGPIVELVHDLFLRGAPLSSEHWRLVEAMVLAVQRRWHEPDHGIWEVRLARRHHVHSKVMCWTTVDRAIRIAQGFMGQQRDDWITLRDTIAADVLEQGYNQRVGAFTAAYEMDDLDAAVLEIGLRGLIDPSDQRFLSTVDRITEGLKLGPTVYRYRYEDGLPGTEGGFHLCTGWLIQALALTGRHSQALELFYQMLELAGKTGLLSEEYGPKTKRSLGNVPQAYSHMTVIDCAVMLDSLEE